MSARGLATGAILVLALAGCSLHTDDIPCSATTACPHGMICGSSGLCVAGRSDGARPDASRRDTMPRPDTLPPPPDMAISCPRGETYCTGTGACTNIQSDPANCGGCGEICNGSVAPYCYGGSCVASCPGTVCADGECHNTTTDPMNCGGCGTVCPAGQSCRMATCAVCATSGAACSASADCCSGTCASMVCM